MPDHKQPIILTPAANGGWIIAERASDPRFMDATLAALSTTGAMIDWLERHLMPPDMNLDKEDLLRSDGGPIGIIDAERPE